MTSNMKIKYEHEKKWNTMDLKSNDLLFSVIDKCYIPFICFHINCGLFMYFIQAHSSLFFLSSSTPPPSVSHPVPEGHICMNRRKWHAYEITKPFTQYSHSSTCTNTKCVRACVCVCECMCMCLCVHCMFIKSQWLIPLSLCLFSVCLSSSISLSVFLFPHLWPVRHPTNSSFKVSTVQLWADPIGSVSPHCDATTHPQIHKNSTTVCTFSTHMQTHNPLFLFHYHKEWLDT